jgi:hypothetical protein
MKQDCIEDVLDSIRTQENDEIKKIKEKIAILIKSAHFQGLTSFVLYLPYESVERSFVGQRFFTCNNYNYSYILLDLHKRGFNLSEILKDLVGHYYVMIDYSGAL